MRKRTPPGRHPERRFVAKKSARGRQPCGRRTPKHDLECVLIAGAQVREQLPFVTAPLDFGDCNERSATSVRTSFPSIPRSRSLSSPDPHQGYARHVCEGHGHRSAHVNSAGNDLVKERLRDRGSARSSCVRSSRIAHCNRQSPMARVTNGSLLAHLRAGDETHSRSCWAIRRPHAGDRAQIS